MVARALPWRTVFRKGYVAIQRGSGYNVALVDVWYRKVPRFAVKIPHSASELGLPNPFPGLAEDWEPTEHLWGWTVPNIDQLPDSAPQST